LPDMPDKYSQQFFQASDGYELAYREYAPSSLAREHVVCIHGIQSHAGWYAGSCLNLRQAGCHVDFLDRRGSGANQQMRGDTPGYRRLVDDLAEFIEARRRTVSAPRLILLAISWGGKLAVALQRRRPGLIDGLVLVTPGFFPQIYPPLKARLRIAWSRLWSPHKLFPIPLDDPRLFTTVPRWLEYLHQDPLSLHEATARFLVSSAHLDRQLRKAAACVRVRTLLLLAEKDRIIDNERTRRYFETFPTSDKQIVEYSGASHTLEFEEPPKFLDDLVPWVLRHP
jgi:acylglycerol lipase